MYCVHNIIVITVSLKLQCYRRVRNLNEVTASVAAAVVVLPCAECQGSLL